MCFPAPTMRLPEEESCASQVKRATRLSAVSRRAFLLLLGAIPAYAQNRAGNVIRFDLIQGVPRIPALANGNKVRLLVDTGAARSVLAEKLVRDAHSDANNRMRTAGGDILLRSGRALIAVGDFSTDLRNVLVGGSITGNDAEGILGNDFWVAAGGVTLDYKRQTLTIGPEPCV